MIDDKYVRLYDPAHWDRINKEYKSAEFIPDYKIIGSVDDYALCIGNDKEIYIIPFIPLNKEFSEKYARNIEELQILTESKMIITDDKYDKYGLELHFVTPIIFGGSPADPSNRKYVPQPQHAELCNFWNSTYYRIKNTKSN